MKRYILLWFPMIVLAVLNGTLRDLGYRPYLGELAAHQVSTLTLLVLLGVYIRWVIHRFPPTVAQQAWLIGLVWLVLTLMFEFGLGLARGHSMSELLRDYNLFQGRIWVFIPLWTLIAPRFFYRLH